MAVADEVAAVGVEAFLDQQIDLAQIHVTEIDRDLFAIGDLHLNHPMTICMDGIWMANL